MICSAVIVFMFVFSNQIFNVLKVVMGYDEYAGNYGFKQVTFFMLLLALTVVAFIQYKKIINQESNAIQYYNGLILSWFIFPMVIEDPSALRLLYMFAFVLLPLVPLIVKSFNKTRNETFVAYVIVISVFCLQVVTSGLQYEVFWGV